MKILRFVLAFIVGCIALGVTVWTIEAAGHALYPPTAEFTSAIRATLPHPTWMTPVGFAGSLAAGVAVGLCVRHWRAPRHASNAPPQ